MRAEEFRERVDKLGFAILGQRLLRARTFHDLSVRDLADRAQVSKNTITRIEKGLPVHIETLKILARALKLKLDELVAADFHLGHTVAIHRKDSGRWFDIHTYSGTITSSPELPSNPADWGPDALPFSPLASRDPEGRFNPSWMVLRSSTETRSHRGEEFAIVMKGSMRVHFDERSIELAEGDSIYFWAAENHSYEPIGEGVEVLSIVLDPFPSRASGLRFSR